MFFLDSLTLICSHIQKGIALLWIVIAQNCLCVHYTLIYPSFSVLCACSAVHTPQWLSRWILIDPARQKWVCVSYCRTLGKEPFSKSHCLLSLISIFLILFKYLKIRSASSFSVKTLFNWFQTHLPLLLNQLFNAIVKSVHFICLWTACSRK